MHSPDPHAQHPPNPQAGWVLAEWLIGSTLLLMSLTLALRLMGDLHLGQQALSQAGTQQTDSQIAAAMIRRQLHGLEQANSHTEVSWHASGSPMWTLTFQAQPDWGLTDCTGHSGSPGQTLSSRYWIDRSTLYCLAGSNPVAQPLLQGVNHFHITLWQRGTEGLQPVAMHQRVNGPALRRVEWGWHTRAHDHTWAEALRQGAS